MVIEVKDQNGAPAANIPIELSGAVSGSYRSDPRGLVRDSLPKGSYIARIPTGCDDTLQIRWGSSVKLEILPGSEAFAKVNVDWRHRYRPYRPSSSTQTGFWRIGEIVEVQFYVVDQCRDRVRTPRVSYPTFAFKLSPNLELVEEPTLMSNENGAGSIRLRCIGPGYVSLTSFDAQNEPDSVDLLSEEVHDINALRPTSCKE